MNLSDNSSNSDSSTHSSHSTVGREESNQSPYPSPESRVPSAPPPHQFMTSARTVAQKLGHWTLYIAMAYFLYQIEGWLLTNLRTNIGNSVWRLLVEAIMMIAAVLPGFIMARLEHTPFGEFGLPLSRAFHKNFFVGSFWGLASLTVLIVTLRITHSFDFGLVLLRGPRLVKFAAYYAALFLATALFEEFLLRGYSQWILSHAFSFWPAAICLSAAFGYIHKGNPGEAKTGLLAAGLIGFFLCLTLRRTGDLWWAVGFHMAWDWGESFLYSVPDSGILLPGHLLSSRMHGPDWLTGGSVGPEGSYLIFVIVTALWIAFNFCYPEVKYPRQKEQTST